MQMCRRESGFVNRSFRRQVKRRPSGTARDCSVAQTEENHPEDSSESLSRGTQTMLLKRPHCALDRRMNRRNIILVKI
jgi:hypothetical protein